MNASRILRVVVPTRLQVIRQTLVNRCSVFVAAIMTLMQSSLVFAQLIPPPLNDELTHAQISEGARNLVICIHGWNNPPNPNHNRYTEVEWAALVEQLEAALPKNGSDPWELLLYHWEEGPGSADTGGVFDGIDQLNENAVTHANQAAIYADSHGQSLGPRLPLSLRRVHIVAHSAGAWAARQTASSILANNKFGVVQITLLDPYIPDNALPRPYQHSYSDSLINDLVLTDFLNSGRISLLENYYADDGFPYWDSTQTTSFTEGTQETFSWRTGDINQEVEWGSWIISPPRPTHRANYHWHSGPILFYADTVQATLGTPSPRLPTDNPFDYHQRGWYRSFYYRTLQGELPKITSQPIGQSSTGNAVLLSVTASGQGTLLYQWYKNNSLIIGAESSTYNVTSSTDPPTPYVVRITDANGNRLFSDRAVVTFYSAPPPPPPVPSIASVSPSVLTGLPLPQTQLIRIFGSGFTPNSSLLFNGTIGSDPSRLYLISPNEIDYYIRTDVTPANWTVEVIDGAKQSNLGYFSVIAPTPNTGSLVVNLSPPGAISAGAQWRVDGSSYHNNGETVSGLTPGSHTVSFKAISGYSTPANQIPSILANQQTTLNASYSVSTPGSYSLTLNQVGTGSIAPQPVGTWNGNAYVYQAGATVQLSAIANIGYHFVGWGNALSGTVNPTTITMDGNKTVSANFASGDPNLGTVIVTIQPPEAAAAGVTWGFNENDFRASGSSYTTWPATYILTLHSVDGWLGPSILVATVTAGQTSSYVANFTQDATPGLLTVTLSPPNVIGAGAGWHLNGGATQGNGTTVALAPGTYTVSFDSIAGWVTPFAQSIQVFRGKNSLVTGNYTPPAGQPLITSVHPNFAPLAGGTVLTVEGNNFVAPVSVSIGSQAATNVNVLGPSLISCVVPSNSVYGTQPVIVHTPSGSATNLNGFAYGNSRGDGIEQVSSIGGRHSGVAVQGNYAYVGEGSSLLVLNVSNPTSPTFINRVSLPDKVSDIALNGQYVYVADGKGGIQVVDSANPFSPALKGFYQTPGWATGVAVQGTNAYIADGAGLEILDISDPIHPSLVSATNYNGAADAILLQTNAVGAFVYLCAGSSLSIFDVTQSASPILRGYTTVGSSWTFSTALLGNYLFLATANNGLHMVDISNMGSPLDLGQVATMTRPFAVTTANNLVYTADEFSGLGVFSISGNSLTRIGYTTTVKSGAGFHMAVTETHSYVAGGTAGFEIADVSNPANPTKLATFTDSGACGDYYSVAISGNFICADVANGGFSDFKVFDVSQPGQPTLVGLLSGIGMGRQVLARNGIAYLIGNGVNNAQNGCTRIISLANPSSPQLLTTVLDTTVWDYNMFLATNTLFIAGQNTANQPRLCIVDVSNPATPVVRGTMDFSLYDVGSFAYGTAASGTRALVAIQPASGPVELKILDVSNLAAPSEIATITNVGHPADIQLSSSGNHAYLIQANAGSLLQILDVNTGIVLTNIPLDSTTGRSLELRGHELYAATVSGMYVFNISNPASATLVRSYLRFGICGVSVPDDSSVQTNLICLANLDGGMELVAKQDREAPSVTITNPTTLPVFTNAVPSLSLSGIASDNSGVAGVSWSNIRGGGGIAVGGTNWAIADITLLPGTNLLSVTAFDSSGNTGNAQLTVIYQSTNLPQTITFSAITDHVFGDPPINLVAAASSGLPVSFTVLSGSASISNNVFTFLGAGNVTVRATQLGGPGFDPASSVDRSFSVSKAEQSISFEPPGDKSISDAPFLLNASASSQLPVTFSVVTGSVTLAANTVTLTGAGSVTIRASQPGNTNFNAAPDVDRTFNISKLPQFITFNVPDRQSVGDAPFTLSAMASSGLPVSFSLLAGPAILSSNIVTITGAGLVVLRASQYGDATYAPAPNVDQVLLVAPGNNIITDIQRFGNGMITFRFYGDPTTNYVVLGSTDFGGWQKLATNQVSSLGYFDFTDIVATNYGYRFYRVGNQSVP